MLWQQLVRLLIILLSPRNQMSRGVNVLYPFVQRDCHDACDGLYLRQSYISCLREATALLPIRAQRGAGATTGCNHHGRPSKV